MKALPFGMLALANCIGPNERIEWAADDPQRPMIVAVASSEAPRIEAAARTCGMHNLQRVIRSELAWIIMRDVLARESETSQPVRCLASWAMAHPEVRVFFYGRTERATND